jgi:hypothetical protein
VRRLRFEIQHYVWRDLGTLETAGLAVPRRVGTHVLRLLALTLRALLEPSLDDDRVAQIVRYRR